MSDRLPHPPDRRPCRAWASATRISAARMVETSPESREAVLAGLGLERRAKPARARRSARVAAPEKRPLSRFSCRQAGRPVAVPMRACRAAPNWRVPEETGAAREGRTALTSAEGATYRARRPAGRLPPAPGPGRRVDAARPR